jgi:hypothetical protein
LEDASKPGGLVLRGSCVPGVLADADGCSDSNPSRVPTSLVPIGLGRIEDWSWISNDCIIDEVDAALSILSPWEAGVPKGGLYTAGTPHFVGTITQVADVRFMLGMDTPRGEEYVAGTKKSEVAKKGILWKPGKKSRSRGKS